MITFKMNEEKIMFFEMMVEGLEKDQLQVKFNLLIDGVEYGFPGIVEGNKIKVTIPPLKTILKEDIHGVHTGKLRVIGDNKYYLKPFTDTIEIVIEPKITTQLDKILDMPNVTENVKMKAHLTSTIDKTEPKKVINEKKKTNSMLRSKLT